MTDDFDFEISPEGEELVPEAEIKVLEQPVHKWVVEPFGGDNPVQIFLPNRPGLIRRFFMWAFFGWKFERVHELGKVFEDAES